MKLKLAVTGKGGVGKTTVGALLCFGLQARNRQVIAVDADSNPNLAYALGFPAPENITPLVEMEDLIREKTGAEKGRYGAYFKMNPDVADIPQRFKHVKDRITLLVMGAVKRGGGGCACPEYVLIRNLISHLLLNEDQDMVIDMEAGLEHLGRGVTEKVDVLLVVVQPDRVSCLTAERVFKLARDIKIRNIFWIGNQIRSKDDESYLKKAAKGVEFLGFLPFHPEMLASQKEGKTPFAVSGFKELTQELIDRIEGIRNG